MHQGDEEFLSRIVAGDETWVHRYEPESRRKSMGVETPGIAKEEEIQDWIFRGKGDANRFFFGGGTQKVLYWKTTWERGVRSTVQATVICWPTI
jgi:hypothetical protein